MFSSLGRRVLINSKCSGAAVSKALTQVPNFRSISIGTDMLSSVVSLQKSRPWSMTPEISNMATDNAVSLTEIFDKKTVVVFGVPAPFTGTCTLQHYPGYRDLAPKLLKAGADEIVCYAVSDPYAHYGWEKSLENDESQIRFLADADGSFAKAYGIDVDYSATSLGIRSQRFSMIVMQGQVTVFHQVEDAAGDAAQILQDLTDIAENKEELNQ